MHNYTATLPSPYACIKHHTSYPMSHNPISFPFPLSNLNIYNLYSILFASYFSANIIYGNEWTMSKRCPDACGIHGFFPFLVFLSVSFIPLSIYLPLFTSSYYSMYFISNPRPFSLSLFAVVVFLNDLGVGLLPFLAFCTCAVEMNNYLRFYLFPLYSTLLI
jgi:hypothetical protein